MVRPLYIVGTGGLAREMALLVEQLNSASPRWSLEGYIAEREEEVGRSLGRARVVGDDRWALDATFEADLVIAIGHPRARGAVSSRYALLSHRFAFPNLIHPSVHLDPTTLRIGRGNVLTAHSLLSCDVVLGDFNLVNWGVTLGHDVVLGDANVVNPGSNLAGHVRLGSRILVGTGCQVLEGIPVEDDATLGAGSLIREPVGAGQTIVGVPGRPLPR